MALQGCKVCACYRISLFIRRARQIAKHVDYAAYHTATDVNIPKSQMTDKISQTTRSGFVYLNDIAF